MTIVLWIAAGLMFIVSWLMNRDKAKRALLKAARGLVKISPTLLLVMIAAGIALAFIEEETIHAFLGIESGFSGIVAGLAAGCVLFLPSFVAFPLGAALLRQGAGLPQIGAFISTLMGVGLISLPLEIRYFGGRLSFLRTGLCILTAVFFVAVLIRVCQ